MATKDTPIATKDTAKENTYTIGGITVDFPCKAYSTQVSMMSMIIKGIERQQNGLLESPTGSGKSLALLCATLAWQRNEQKKQHDEDTEKDKEDDVLCKCSCNKTPSSSGKTTTVTSPPEEVHSSPAFSPDNIPPEVDATPKHPSSNNATGQTLSPGKNCRTRERTPRKAKRGLTPDDQDADDFQPSKKKPKRTSSVKKKKKTSEVAECEEEVIEVDSAEKTPCQCHCHSAKDKDKDTYKRRRVPKIYFGTRTHKQIAQLIKELGKTAYKDVQMSILGSREHTCVHPVVSAGPYKNEGCKELLDGRTGGSCTFFNGVHKMKHQWQLRDRGVTEVWDIEDLVTLGKKIKACPYYATRSLKDDADIIFCPYNYLVDPIIRSTMEINLKGQIVVLDEAHNIEDSAREAASCSVTGNQLEDTVNELETHITNKWRKKPCKILHAVMNALLTWFKCQSSKFDNRKGRLFDRALKVWSGVEMVAVLKDFGIAEDTLPTFMKNLALLLDDPEPQKKEQEEGVSLSSSSGMTLKNLFVIFGFLLKDRCKFMKDFKVVIMRTQTFAKPRQQSTDDRWITKNKRTPSWPITLNFWCLNPAVAFTGFGEETRTIILTSGTLSPMASFQSELGVEFPIQLEYSHVVNMSQVWIASIAEGPNGETLNGCYKNAETFKFQDEVGCLLHQVCQKIPFGVLCFFPSYGMMDKLTKRWKNTGLWEKLTKVKVVMSETRGADKVNFERNLREYYEVIENLEQKLEQQASFGEGEVTGALFLAVCRGKVSEGMDFADNNARAVMTVGIPYPSIRDTQVELKQQYNDTYATSRGLLTGSEWYEIQAYRAINQALGRCIRHKKDWGALILADHRFSKNPKKYTPGLSKWVRNNLNHHTSSKTALTSLEEFAKERRRKKYSRLPSTPICPKSSSKPSPICPKPSPGPLTQFIHSLMSPLSSPVPGEPVAISSAPPKVKYARTRKGETPGLPSVPLPSVPIQPRNLVPLLPKLKPSQKSSTSQGSSFNPYSLGPNKELIISMNPSQKNSISSYSLGPNKELIITMDPTQKNSNSPNSAGPNKELAVKMNPEQKNSIPTYSLGPNKELVIKMNPQQGQPGNVVAPAMGQQATPITTTPMKFFMNVPNTSNTAPLTLVSGPSPVLANSSAPGFGQAVQSPMLASNQQVMPGCLYALGPKNKLIPVLPGTSMGSPAQLVSNSSNNTLGNLTNPELAPTQPTSSKFVMVAPKTSNVAPNTSNMAPNTSNVAPNTSNTAPAILASGQPGLPSQTPSVAAKNSLKQASPNNEPTVKSNSSTVKSNSAAGKPSKAVVPRIQGTNILRVVKVAPKIKGTTIDTPVALQKAPGVGWFSTISPDSSKRVNCKVTLTKFGKLSTQGNAGLNTPREKINFGSTPSRGPVRTKSTKGVCYRVIDLTDEPPTKDSVKGQGNDNPTTPQPGDEQTILNKQIIRAEHDYTPPLFDSDIVDSNTTTTPSDHSDDTSPAKTTDRREDGGSKKDLVKSARLSRQLKKRGGVYFADETIPKRYKRLAFEKSLCRIGLFCKTCGKRVLLHMKGVSLIPDAKVADKFSYLLDHPKPRFLKPKKSKRMCWCENCPAATEGGAQQDANSFRSSFINISSSKHLKNVSVLSNRPSKGFVRNAHWSQKDQCCYQPIRCAVCDMRQDVKTSVIGYKVVAVAPDLDSSLANQVWLYPSQVGYCRGLGQRQHGDGSTSS